MSVETEVQPKGSEASQEPSSLETPPIAEGQATSEAQAPSEPSTTGNGHVQTPDNDRTPPVTDRPQSPNKKRSRSESETSQKNGEAHDLSAASQDVATSSLTTDAHPAQSPTNGDSSPPPSAPADPAPAAKRTKLTSTTKAQELTRSKRLFTTLMGTLSSHKASAPNKRRTEVESAQRERLRMRQVEEEEERQRRLDDVQKIREQEGRDWEEESMRRRHEAEKCFAGFLGTQTMPRLYWRPWKLREDDVATLDRQRREAEVRIKQEVAEFRRERGEAERVGESEMSGDKPENEDTVDEDTSTRKEEAELPKAKPRAAHRDTELNSKVEDSINAAEAERGPKVEPGSSPARDNPDGDEEMVAADGEDAVIY
ncbi:MAG: hypothetical protein M1828_004137 [Chrysothrix sp. TS-e1954]|nr:MAG: hypothetical protein M1828_004137 [Chrysothrix sp. TS-e1954]